jgi:hypothetical protein
MSYYHFRKTQKDSGNCPNGCAGCKHYPYFHYLDDKHGEDIESIKSLTVTKVINHTTNVTHVYNGNTWELQK